MRKAINLIDYYLPLYLGIEVVHDYCSFWSMIEVEIAIRFWKIYKFNAL